MRSRNGRSEWALTAFVAAIWLIALWAPEINPWLEWALFLGGLAVVGFLAGDARILLGLLDIPILALLHPEPDVRSLWRWPCRSQRRSPAAHCWPGSRRDAA